MDSEFLNDDLSQQIFTIGTILAIIKQKIFEFFIDDFIDRYALLVCITLWMSCFFYGSNSPVYYLRFLPASMMATYATVMGFFLKWINIPHLGSLRASCHLVIIGISLWLMFEPICKLYASIIHAINTDQRNRQREQEKIEEERCWLYEEQEETSLDDTTSSVEQQEDTSFVEEEMSTREQAIPVEEQRNEGQNLSYAVQEPSYAEKELSHLNQDASFMPEGMSTMKQTTAVEEQKNEGQNLSYAVLGPSYAEKEFSHLNQDVSFMPEGMSTMEPTTTMEKQNNEDQNVSYAVQETSYAEKELSDLDQDDSFLIKEISTMDQTITVEEQEERKNQLCAKEEVTNLKQDTSLIEQKMSSEEEQQEQGKEGQIRLYTDQEQSHEQSHEQKTLSNVEQSTPLIKQEVLIMLQDMSSVGPTISYIKQIISSAEEQPQQREEEQEQSYEKKQISKKKDGSPLIKHEMSTTEPTYVEQLEQTKEKQNCSYSEHEQPHEEKKLSTVQQDSPLLKQELPTMDQTTSTSMEEQREQREVVANQPSAEQEQAYEAKELASVQQNTPLLKQEMPIMKQTTPSIEEQQEQKEQDENRPSAEQEQPYKEEEQPFEEEEQPYEEEKQPYEEELSKEKHGAPLIKQEVPTIVQTYVEDIIKQLLQTEEKPHCPCAEERQPHEEKNLSNVEKDNPVPKQETSSMKQKGDVTKTAQQARQPNPKNLPRTKKWKHSSRLGISLQNTEDDGQHNASEPVTNPRRRSDPSRSGPITERPGTSRGSLSEKRRKK